MRSLSGGLTTTSPGLASTPTSVPSKSRNRLAPLRRLRGGAGKAIVLDSVIVPGPLSISMEEHRIRNNPMM
jgi:hypothetical protein